MRRREARVKLRVLLVAVGSALVVGVALVLLLGDTQAGTEQSATPELRQVASRTGPEGVGAASPVSGSDGLVVQVASASSDACGFVRGFHALGSSIAASAAEANAGSAGGQSQTSESTQRNTVRSGSRVTVNGVVVHDDTEERTTVAHNESAGGGTQASASRSTSESTSTSVSSSSSSSRSRVTVNGEVVKDEDVVRKAVDSSLVRLVTSVIAKRLHFESRLLVGWYVSVLAGPGCASASP
jgi:hypothetical protein